MDNPKFSNSLYHTGTVQRDERPTMRRLSNKGTLVCCRGGVQIFAQDRNLGDPPDSVVEFDGKLVMDSDPELDTARLLHVSRECVSILEVLSRTPSASFWPLICRLRTSWA